MPTKNLILFLIKGLYPTQTNLYDINMHIEQFNNNFFRSLNALCIIVSSLKNRTLEELDQHISSYINQWGSDSVLGAFITMVNTPKENISFSLLDETTEATYYCSKQKISELRCFDKINFLGAIEWNKKFLRPRIKDLLSNTEYSALFEGDINRRIKKITMCSRLQHNVIKEFQAGTLIVTSADRADILLSACLAAKKGIKLAGVLITADYYLNQDVINFCQQTIQETQLPILSTKNKSIKTILELSKLDFKSIPEDDADRLKAITEAISHAINKDVLLQKIQKPDHIKLSPPAFKYFLLKKAQEKKKRIILPESYEPRTLRAAASCVERGIAHCVLIGNRDELEEVANKNGFNLPEDIEVISKTYRYDEYLSLLLELRKNKGLSLPIAKDLLEKPMYLATLMLYKGEVDGIVSGAEQTTADTVRPPLQLIKMNPESSLVSSIFFMCMDDQVLIYADCAINQDPNADQLADIAIQSAQSAKLFGIESNIAMISYSTGNSGFGDQVEKVKLATELVRKKRPDLNVDGPLQYDAAMIKSVARKKIPNSTVAGRATVLIFPDLNTGNTVYKAVQRSANVLSIGPMLQGMRKPVNDLSRGATIDDIIYTIAITAIQAQL